MGYRIEDWTAIDAEVRRIAREQLDRALAALADDSLDEPARVHVARKRAKKVRSLLRLVRPRLKRKLHRRLDRHFRDLARRVSDVRDAAVHVETYDRVCAHAAGGIDRRGTASIRAALTRRRNAALAAREHEERLARLAADLERGRALIETIEFRGKGGTSGFAPLRDGFVAGYERARASGAVAREAGTAEAYHEWRKRVKHHRHHLKLLGPLWPVPIAALHEEAGRLGERLGHAHDVAALDEHLAAEPDALGAPRHVESFVGFARALREELERTSGSLGERLFAERGERVGRRFEALYEAAG